MMDDLPRGARLFARLIPAGDRESILGDLLEGADDRDLRGDRRRWWLAMECGAIAAGLSIQRVRAWVVLPPVRELAAGLVVDGRGALRLGDAPGLGRALLFCASVAVLALGAELLVSTLLAAF